MVSRVPKRILRQTHSIAAHVRAAQMQKTNVEAFDAANLSFNVGCGRQAFQV